MKQQCTLTTLSAEAEGAALQGQISKIIVLCHFLNCTEPLKFCNMGLTRSNLWLSERFAVVTS